MNTTDQAAPRHYAQPVNAFSYLRAPQLDALKAELGLSVSTEGLLFCQKHFTAMGRDPLVGELQFLAALSKELYRLPTSSYLTELCFEDTGDMRVWQDICRKRGALDKHDAPYLSDVMESAALYLARCGCTPQHTALCADIAPRLATAAGGHVPTLALDIDGVCGALMQRTAALYSPQPGLVLLALTGADAVSLAIAVARFQADYAALLPVPIAVIGEEGLGPHLAGLPCGTEFDTLHLPGYDSERGTASLVTACKNTVIFALPRESANALLAGGSDLRLIGRLAPHDHVVLRDGIQLLLSLPRRFIGAWKGRHGITLTVPADNKGTAEAKHRLCENDTQLLAGVAVSKGALQALLSLLRAVWQKGGSMESLTLAAVLTLPERGEARGLSLLLEYHRFAAELAIPATTARVVLGKRDTAPCLTVFMATDKESRCRDVSALDNALQAGDFDLVRAALWRECAAHT